MNTIDICSKLERVTYLVNSFPDGADYLDPETSYGIGSGVAINSRGYLLTAAHVIAGGIPVHKEQLIESGLNIVAKTNVGNPIQYQCIQCGLAIDSDILGKPLTIDLALLCPAAPQDEVPFLKISEKRAKIGTQVVMAGYPEDIELPFSFDRILNPRYPGIEVAKKYMYLIKNMLMMKSGMIGHSNQAKFFDGNDEVCTSIYYVDNELHGGGSGGPVVNHNAEIVGIVTQRSIIPLSIPPIDVDDPKSTAINFEVPSGLALAVSPFGFIDYIQKHYHVDI